MALFKTCVRNCSSDGYYNVYIRVTHKGKIDYIRTDKRIKKSDVKKNEIKNNSILLGCARLIDMYITKLNQLEIKHNTLSVQQIVDYLETDNAGISFTDFAKTFIDNMINDGREKPSKNYATAVNNLKKYLQKDKVVFTDITSKVIREWIKSLAKTKRAKNLYPNCINSIFKAGLNHFNDYDNNLICISNRPFESVKIPSADPSAKRAIDKDDLLKLFHLPTHFSRDEMAQDVCKMMFYLAGINTVDLYEMEKSNLKNWKLCYNRHKEETIRKDKAYIEIYVPEQIRPYFKKYAGKTRLFNFSERYSDSDGFNKAANKGLKILTKNQGLPKITTYVIRHTWGTIAQNNCGASTEMVAFALNHASAHKVTEGYIKKDYSPIDRLNQRVIDFVFGNSLLSSDKIKEKLIKNANQ